MYRVRETNTFWFMAPLVLGNMLNPLNSTMLATAIVSICGAFGQDLGTGALLIVPLYLTSAIGQPLMGRLADIFSARRINLLGFVVILISALIGVLARNFSWLIVSRVLLGLGSSAAYPSAMTMIRQRYAALHQEVPGRILGLLAIASQVSIAFGPFLGGVLTEHFGWQGIFFVNIPLVLIALALSWVSRREQAPVKKKAGQVLKELDLPGVLTFAIFLIIFLLTLLYPSWLWIKIPLVLLALIVFISVEVKHPQPFIDMRLLVMNVPLSTTFLRQVAINFVMYMTIYGMPQWMEQSKGISPSRVGLLMLPLSLAAMLCSLLVSGSKHNNRLLLAGTLSIIIASAGFFLLNRESSIPFIMAISILLGIATGVLTIANQATLYAAAPAGQVGISFGLYRTVGYVGAIVAGSRLKHEFHSGATDANLHLLAGYCLAACVMVVIFLIPVFLKKQS
ncbi:MFS transporter [Chitinophaga sp. 212800010-3]|uniref:MFS transporter n=1 Tax=unclassified Chitinophaga TaxID=2619133 RepID=UPI002DEE001A|nr:Major Facilitator Superfamily protein [Chitinophaga sp. 212800010-3]